jgi:methyl-accepting chemotaxis protein
VNNNITSIRDISQETNDRAEEAAHDGEKLITMSSDLRGLLEQFKTSG